MVLAATAAPSTAALVATHAAATALAAAVAATATTLAALVAERIRADVADRGLHRIGSRTRSYKDGIPLHKLKLIGGGYVKPDKNVPVLGLTADTTDNAKLTFSAADIETAVSYQNAANGGPAGSLAGKVFTITKMSASMGTSVSP